jgi:hypothetical protein
MDYILSLEFCQTAVQVIAYFSYINRIADGLGVEPEAFIRPWGDQPARNSPTNQPNA